MKINGIYSLFTLIVLLGQGCAGIQAETKPQPVVAALKPTEKEVSAELKDCEAVKSKQLCAEFNEKAQALNAARQKIKDLEAKLRSAKDPRPPQPRYAPPPPLLPVVSAYPEIATTTQPTGGQGLIISNLSGWTDYLPGAFVCLPGLPIQNGRPILVDTNGSGNVEVPYQCASVLAGAGAIWVMGMDSVTVMPVVPTNKMAGGFPVYVPISHKTRTITRQPSDVWRNYRGG